MPNEPGFFDSPGERARRERFQRTRTEVLDVLGPSVVDGLRSAAESTDESLTQLAQSQGILNLRAPTITPRLRPTPPSRLAPPTVTPTPPVRGPLLGLQPPTVVPRPAFRAVDEPFAIPPAPGRLVGEERRPPSPFAAADERTERIRTRGTIEDPFPSVLELFESLEAVLRPGVELVGKPVTGLLRIAAETAGPTIGPGGRVVTGRPPGPSAERLVEEPSFQTISEIGAEVPLIPEILNPLNFVAIPFLEAEIARVVGIALPPIGRFVTTRALRDLIGQATRRLDDVAFLPREQREGLTRFVQEGEQNLEQLVAERPLVGAAEEVPGQTATGEALPARGKAGAQAALNLKEETLRRPGPLTQLPGVKQVASGLNPAVSIDRQVLVSYNARQAVSASLETEFAALRRPVTQRLQGAWDAQPPRYTGPEANAMKNTIKDWADNPDFYTAISPELRAAARAYDDVSNQILARTRGEFGVDINAFSSAKAGSFYLPTVQARETLDDALLKVSQGYTSSGVPVSSARAKARVYEGAYQRSVKNPGFQAETDLAELTGLHDRALATMGGNETFRLGAGGRSRLDVMQELHPELASRMIFLRQRLTNLRSQAGRLNDKTRGAIDEFLANPDGSLSDLADALDVRVTRGRLKGVDVRGVNAEIRSVRQEIRSLRPAWESANLEPFVLNRSTFRYHQAEQSAAVDRILQTKLPMGEGLLQAIDEVRLTAFAADVSPLTIQGLLGFLSDPITGARSLPRVLKTLFRPEELLRVAQREPELVARFTQSTGRPFGELGGEFVQRRRGIERLPGGRQLNESLMSAVEMLRYNQWKTDTALLQRLNPGMSQAVADAEAANALSKIIPALNPAERGVSRLQARLERTPVISTSFIGGPATVIKDATAGLAKLTASRSLSPAARWQALSGREQLAILHLGSISGTVATAAVGSHILSGFSPEEAVKATLDPNSPRFLSIALGPERRIPIGGPLRSAIRAFVPREVGEIKGVPVYVPFAGTPQWLKGKVTPALKAPFDLARDADYFGGKIATGSFPESMLRSLWFAANSVLPLAIQEPSEAIRRGEIEPTDVAGIAERAGAQLAGVDLRETSATEELRLAFREETGRDWDGSEAARRVAEGNERLRPLLEVSDRQQLQRGFEGAVRREERGEVLGQLAEGMRDLIEGVRAGNPEAGSRLRQEFSTFKAQAFALSLRDALGVDFPDPDTDLGRLVQRYFDVEMERDPETFQPQFAAFDAERDAILKEIEAEAPDVAAALQTRFRLPEEFRDVEERLQEVADLRNQLGDIPQFRGISVDAKRRVDTFLRQVRNARDRAKDEVGAERVLSVPDAIRRVGESQGRSEAFIAAALALNSTSARRRLLNPEYVKFVVDNADQLLFFYPELRSDVVSNLLAQQ